MTEWPPREVRVLKPGFELGSDGSSQKLFVVAFDPGLRTGWWVARVHLDALLSLGFRSLVLSAPDPDVFTWSAGYFQGPEPFQAELMMALCRGTWMYGEGEFSRGVDSDLFVVVGEEYKSRMIGDDATVLAPVRLQAAFVQLSWRAPFPFILSSIPDSMAVFTDDRLRTFNLWSGPDGVVGEHQRDATRYGALVLRKIVSERRYLNRLEKRMPWMGIEKEVDQ